MKKMLLGTSAIALATAVAAPASAAEWDVRVGGYAHAKTAYATTDIDNTVPGVPVDIDGVDIKFDGEVWFLPSITLDNGIKIGANIQLEARSGTTGTPDTIDEAYVYVDGSFGRLDLGDENSAGYKMHYAAPDVTFVGVNSPSSTIFVPYSGAIGGVALGADIFRATLGTTFIENERNNDAGRFTYYTPRFSGFQLGVSYARDATQNTITMINTAGSPASDIFDVGANYVNSFGDFDVAISARWGIATDDRTPVAGTDIGEDPQIHGYGVNLGYAGFTIGGSWAEQNGSGDEDGTAWTAGISYETGPWGVSATWFHGENVSDEDTSGDSGIPSAAFAAAVGPGVSATEEVDNVIVGVTYNLAKGVRVGAYGGYTSFDEEGSVGPVVNTGNDLDGWYIGGGIAVSF